MAKEISDNELKNINGGYDSFVSPEAFSSLGLTLHKYSDLCDSFAPSETASKNKAEYERCCGTCLYGALILEHDTFVDPDAPGDTACLIKK